MYIRYEIFRITGPNLHDAPLQVHFTRWSIKVIKALLVGAKSFRILVSNDVGPWKGISRSMDSVIRSQRSG